MCCSPFFPCPSYNLAWTNQDPLLKMLKMSVCSGFATVSEVGLDPKDLVIACTVYWPRQSHFISAQAERGSKKEKKLKLSVIRKVDPVASSGSDFRERVSFPIPVYIQGSRILLLPLLFNLLYPSISEERRVDTNGSGPPFGIPSPRHDFPLDRHSLASPRQPRLLTPAMDTATPTQTFTPTPYAARLDCILLSTHREGASTSTSSSVFFLSKEPDPFQCRLYLLILLPTWYSNLAS
jgi:hypothetical protein